jgi:membrane complex biogenesis BtpA family protein
MDRAGVMEAVCGARRALIGVVHVAALPGTPEGRLGVAEIAEAAVADARVYRAAGFDALIIENMHDRPYLKGSVGPEIVAAMTAIGIEVRRAVGLPLGVQVLAGANREAMAVAHACGATFVRVEGFVFAHVADEGLIEACAGPLLRYRKAIGADHVRVFADIKKKHSAHAITADVDLVETAHAAEFFGADAVVVSGPATGRETDAEEVRAVSAAICIATLVGSGITVENVDRYADADGLIVGSSVKRDGCWANPVDEARAASLVRDFRRARSS